MKLGPVFFIMAMLPLVGHAFELQLNPRGLLPAQIPALQSFINETASKLPPQMREALTKPITVNFQQASERHAGMAFGNSIFLNANFITEILKGPSNSKSPQEFYKDPNARFQHPTMYQLAQASVLHEISHLYDFRNIQPSEDISFISACEGQQTEDCRLYHRRTTISDNPTFLSVSGWPEIGFLAPSRHELNHVNDRSPDPYEWTNPRETFAVNMEYFLLDRDFACRRPGLYNYLSAHFQYKPFGEVSCDPVDSVLLAGSSFAGTSSRFQKLDFSKLYEIHYFFAGPGESVQSRWGHAMLRFVFCAPERTTVGPECVHDIGSHVIVNYRAQVDGLSLNKLDAITGKYTSMLYMSPLVNIIEEYNKQQFRDIYSVPLKLSREEMHSIFSETMENHWSYEGKYYFLSNNCATETANLLRASLDYTEHRDFANGFIATPEGLLKLLQQTGLASNGIFKDLKKAEKESYFFPSRRAFYEQQYQTMLTAFPELKGKTLDQFLETTSAEERSRLADQAITAGQKKVVGSMAILEALLLQKQKAKIMGEVMNNFMHEKKEGTVRAKEIEGKFTLVAKTLSQASSPSRIVKTSSYGLPTKVEFAAAAEAYNKDPNIQAVAALAPALQEELKHWSKPGQVNELESIRDLRNRLIDNFVK